MTVYCGVDLHARAQTICWCDTSDGEIHYQELNHQQDDVRGFYAQFPGEVIVGLEAGGYSTWFEAMLEELKHTVWLGNATEIRRTAKRGRKTDRMDAEHMLDLLMGGSFPRIHRRSAQSQEVLRLLRYRHRLVKMRTMVKNSLQAMAISLGLPLKRRLWTQHGRRLFECLPMSPVMDRQRREWLSLLDQFQARIESLEDWLSEQAQNDERARRLRTHPGIGLLTSLGVVHTMDPVSRFSGSREVVAYVGLNPMDHSSDQKTRSLGISKAGSRLLRFLLVEAAHTAVRADEDLGHFYRRLTFRRGPNKALVAVARKLVIRSFIMLRDRIDYTEFLHRGVEARSAREARRLTHA